MLVLKVRECLQEGHWASARKTTTERPGGQCEGHKGNVCVHGYTSNATCMLRGI